jgi:hypothetical protein
MGKIYIKFFYSSILVLVLYRTVPYCTVQYCTVQDKKKKSKISILRIPVASPYHIKFGHQIITFFNFDDLFFRKFRKFKINKDHQTLPNFRFIKTNFFLNAITVIIWPLFLHYFRLYFSIFFAIIPSLFSPIFLHYSSTIFAYIPQLFLPIFHHYFSIIFAYIPS